ncbi:MAG: FliH/SctL family protein [Hydrogenophilus sp.]|nr:FliH/SctL family protein [Hydrogenophilus sp.]
MPIERHQAIGLYRTLALPSFDDPQRAKEARSDEGATVSAVRPTVAEIEQQIEEARRLGYDEGYRAGHEEGYRAGFEAGRSEGYTAGFTAGHAEGQQAGFTEGLEKGREEGRAQGYADGRAAGEAEARAEWEPLFAERERALAELTAKFADEWQKLPQSLAEGVVALAIEIARAVVTAELTTRPYHVVPLAERLLAEELLRPLTVRLHPEDLALLPEAFTDREGVHWLADPSLMRGSVLLEGSTTIVDASLPSRWQRAVARLYPALAQWKPAELPALSPVGEPISARKKPARSKKSKEESASPSLDKSSLPPTDDPSPSALEP